jgi:hypothetical protein
VVEIGDDLHMQGNTDHCNGSIFAGVVLISAMCPMA